MNQEPAQNQESAPDTWQPIYNNANRPNDPRYHGGGTLLWVTLQLKPDHPESRHYTVNRYRWFVDGYIQKCCTENNYANSFHECRDSSFRNDRSITGRHDDFNGQKINSTKEMDLMPSYKKHVEYWFPTHAEGWEWLQYTIAFWKWVGTTHPEMKITYQYWAEMWDGDITDEYSLQWDSMWHRSTVEDITDKQKERPEEDTKVEDDTVENRQPAWPVQVSEVPSLQKMTSSKDTKGKRFIASSE